MIRASQYLIATLKETPTDAEVVSHQLMVRAGLIRKLATGLYTWLPAGLRVLHKVTAVVREEMNRAGAMEVSMPVVQSADLWIESGRWDKMGPELLSATREFLSDSDKVPRRASSSLRGDAGPRVPDEGRLLLPYQRRLAAADL